MKASIITIGTELLIGQIIDTNSAYLGKALESVGVEIVSKLSVNDTREDMLKAFGRGIEDADIIIVTGGLGPTRDDITKKVIAEFLGVEMYFDDNEYENIQAFFTKINRPIQEAHKQQCYFPTGVKFLENNIGTAPGMLFEHKGKKIISMPGVPYEMKHIVENHVLELLKGEQDFHLLHKTIQTAGIGETVLADLIEDIEDDLPAHIKLAYLPSLGKVRVRISIRGNDLSAIQTELDTYEKNIVERFGDYMFGYDDDSLEKVVGCLLKDQNKRLGLAESCTGGKISSLITSVSGSSAYFEGSIVSYTNRLKHEKLNVKSETLDAFGAVSEETVKEMVKGAIELLKVDVAVSVSGIAGPSGGTDEKPVGLVYICVGDSENQHVRKLTLLKDRIKNIEYSSNAALNLLRLYLENKIS